MPTTSSAPMAVGFVADQADGVFAGVVNHRGQIVNFAFAQRFEHRFQPADHTQRIHRGAQHQFQRAVAHVGKVPHFGAGEVAGDRGFGAFGRQLRIVRGGAHHHHFMDALKRHHGGFDADHGIGPDRNGIVHQSLQRQMPRVVENVAEFFHLAAGHAFQRAHNSAADADRVRNIAKHEFQGRVAGVELAI